jgi:hypothetical protein
MALFIPANYRCRAHDLDLTEEVQQKVEAEPTRVANPGWRWSRPGGRRDEPFRVRVHCPGGEGHDLEFRGSWRRR